MKDLILLGFIILFALYVGWIYFLFRIGQKKDYGMLFFTLLYLPLLLPFIVVAFLSFGAFSTILALFTKLSLWSIILVGVLILEKIAWGVTLKEISGEDKLVWFYIAYIIPFFGWFFYRIVNIR